MSVMVARVTNLLARSATVLVLHWMDYFNILSADIGNAIRVPRRKKKDIKVLTESNFCLYE